MVHKNVFKIQWGLGLWCLTLLSTIFHKIQRDNLKQQNKQVNDTGQWQPGLFHLLIIKITFNVLSHCDISGKLLKLELNTNQSINQSIIWCLYIILFTVNASEAGSGNIEIMINGGTIPCNVQNLSDQGDHYFEASFVPDSPKPHKVEMKFNNKEVTGILLKPVLSILRCSKITYLTVCLKLS